MPQVSLLRPGKARTPPSLPKFHHESEGLQVRAPETATACAGPVIGNMMQLRPAGSWAHQKSAHPFPRLDGTTGSIELGIFDESESGRTKVSQARSHVRTARPSWPRSARFLVGAMFVLNILLAAFLVRTEMKRSEARPEARPVPPATATPLPLPRPNASSTPQLNAPPDQGSTRGLTSPPVEARSAALPSTQRSKRSPIKASPKTLRASKPSRAVVSAPMPRAGIHPPQEPLGRTPAPVRNPAASSSASAQPPVRAASVGIPGAGVPSNAGTHPNAPAASALAPSAIDHGLTAKGSRSGSGSNVASVRLPAMEKGLVTPRKPVAPAGVKIEIIPRPPVKLENCGDNKVFIACPTLKTRYDTPFTSEAP